jgi:hypothetical protein
LLHPLPRVKTQKFSTPSNEVIAFTLMNKVAACFTLFQGEKTKKMHPFSQKKKILTLPTTCSTISFDS